MLDLSKVEAGRSSSRSRTFSLREALERGVVMVRERGDEDGVRLTLELAPDVDLVDGDERRLRQVIYNLLSNAVKFTPEGGSVVVATARVDGEVQVSVADTGPGIAPEDQERIFEEFQQTDVGASSARAPGSGSRSRSAWSSCTAAASGSRASPGTAAASSSRCRSRRRAAMAGERDPRRRGQREEHEALPRRAAGDRIHDARGDDAARTRSSSRCRTRRHSC